MKYSLSHNRYYYAVFLLVSPYLFILNMLSNHGQLINIPSTNNTLAGLINGSRASIHEEALEVVVI